MKKELTHVAAGLAMIALTTQTAFAATCAEDAMLVFDGSGSMAERTLRANRKSRIKDAQEAVRRVMSAC